jgi:ParB-like chromosome segregation protein Spo0J
MQIVPSEPFASMTTYERIQRMSLDISSSPTRAESLAASPRSYGVFQPIVRRIA